MFLHIIKAKYIKDYKVWVKFNDGTTGEVDLADELNEGVFKPLKDKNYFKNFELIGHTLAWQNGADFAPEFLKDRVH